MFGDSGMKFGMFVRPALFIVTMLALAGCGPEFDGEAEYIIKTSEVHKALAGKPARIRLRENVSCPISNAYERVTFGAGRFTNQLEVVRHLVANSGLLMPGFRNSIIGRRALTGTVTNDSVRLSIDESAGRVPLLRMQSEIAVWLSRTNVLDRALEAGEVDELNMMSLDSGDGALKDANTDENCRRNPRLYEFLLCGMHQYLLLGEIFGLETESGVTAAGACSTLAAVPGYISDQYLVIIGDDDSPLTVDADCVFVDGVRHGHLQATVGRGETLRMKVDKKAKRFAVRFSAGERGE